MCCRGCSLRDLLICCCQLVNCLLIDLPYGCLQWVAANVQPKFVLKTDDDAYVSCAKLIAELKSLCKNPDCQNESMYFGQEKHNGVVITEDDSKWSNLEYFQLTGLKEYVPYMLGGG